MRLRPASFIQILSITIWSNTRAARGKDSIQFMLTVWMSGVPRLASLLAGLRCHRSINAAARSQLFLQELRLYFGAPLEYVRDGNGYAYTSPMDTQLPGLWLSEQEILALLTLKQIADDIGPGILAGELKPFSDRMLRLLDQPEHTHFAAPPPDWAQALSVSCSS